MADACILRGRMPQVNERDIPQLLTFVGQRGIAIRAGLINPRMVRGKQKINRAHIRNISPETLEKPVLLSSDNLVLDGNHRWFAHDYRRTIMPFIGIDQPFEQALDTLYAFPKTFQYDDGNFHPIEN